MRDAGAASTSELSACMENLAAWMNEWMIIAWKGFLPNTIKINSIETMIYIAKKEKHTQKKLGFCM